MATPIISMRRIAVLTFLFSTGTIWAFGEPSFEVNARLIGYDLVQVTGKSQTVSDLPRIVVKSGSEKTIDLSKEIKIATGIDSKFIPIFGPSTITHYRFAWLGIRMPIYVRQTEEEGKVTFLLRAEVCERDDDVSPIAKTTSSVRGFAYLGKTKTMTIGTPGGKKATLEITFTAR